MAPGLPQARRFDLFLSVHCSSIKHFASRNQLHGLVGKGGRKLSYKAVVQGNGNPLIGRAYTAMLELNPGDKYEIKLGRKQIRLVTVGGSDEEE